MTRRARSTLPTSSGAETHAKLCLTS